MNRRGRVPLERALSKLGIASRTQARKWILEGRVKIAGKIVRDPLFELTPETAKITLDGLSQEKQAPLTLVLHKPKGVVTTRSDEKGRPTVYSLLEGLAAHVIPVGRLDFATTGLLLLTNDTRLAAWVTDPSNAVPRVYLATVRGELTPEKARRLEEGVMNEGQKLSATRVEIRKASKRETHLTVELAEGKNREIRRMLSQLGHEVTRLKRVSFGGLELTGLEPGKWRVLGADELRKAFPEYFRPLAT